MNGDKVRQFIELAGQAAAAEFIEGTPAQRLLGAQLLLSEVLEYVVHGLGVVPSCKGVPIDEPNSLTYAISQEPTKLDMLDGLADTAYTMYWNAITFGVPVDVAFDMVCDNNLEKFVRLPNWAGGAGALPPSEWGLGLNITWPPEVVRVEVIKSRGTFFGVGTDVHGKVRKPSSYKPVELSSLVMGTVL